MKSSVSWATETLNEGPEMIVTIILPGVITVMRRNCWSMYDSFCRWVGELIFTWFCCLKFVIFIVLETAEQCTVVIADYGSSLCGLFVCTFRMQISVGNRWQEVVYLDADWSLLQRHGSIQETFDSNEQQRSAKYSEFLCRHRDVLQHRMQSTVGEEERRASGFNIAVSELYSLCLRVCIFLSKPMYDINQRRVFI